MPTIAAAQAQLHAVDRPVLFLDTCVIIDIIRATMRCKGTTFVRSAVELRTMLTSAPPSCALVIASVVPTEWDNNAPKTVTRFVHTLQKSKIKLNTSTKPVVH